MQDRRDFVEAAPAFPCDPRIRLPPASPLRCGDGETMVPHLFIPMTAAPHGARQLAAGGVLHSDEMRATSRPPERPPGWIVPRSAAPSKADCNPALSCHVTISKVNPRTSNPNIPNGSPLLVREKAPDPALHTGLTGATLRKNLACDPLEIVENQFHIRAGYCKLKYTARRLTIYWNHPTLLQWHSSRILPAAPHSECFATT